MKPRSIRRWAVLVLIVPLVVLTTAWSDRSTRSTRTTISYSFWGTNTQAAGLEKIVALFNKLHPNVKVTPDWIQGVYTQKLLTEIAAGTESTVIQISDNNIAGFVSAFAPQHLIISKFLSANIPAAEQYKGTYYATPFELGPKAMAVNLDIFKAAGIPPPSKSKPMTLQQYADVATKLSHGSGDSQVFGMSAPWFYGWLTMAGGSFYNPSGTACTFGSPAGVGVAKYLINLQNQGVIPTAAQAQGQDQSQWFAANRLATFTDFGPWDITSFASFTSPNWTLVPIPGKGEPFEVDGLAISKNASSEQAAAAREFIAFATSARAQNVMGSLSIAVPVISASERAFERTLPASRNLAEFFNAAKRAPKNVSVGKDAELENAFYSGLSSDTALGSGNGDPAEVLPRLQQECTTALRQK